MSKKEDDTTPLEKLIGAVIVLVIIFFVYRCKWSDDNDSKYDKKVTRTEQTTTRSESIVGTYTTTGWYGDVKLIINNDGTVIAKTVVTDTYKDEYTGKVHQGTRERTFYGAWKKRNDGAVSLAFSEHPRIFLGNSRGCFIKNEYIYEDITAMEANDPTSRFKLTKR